MRTWSRPVPKRLPPTAMATLGLAASTVVGSATPAAADVPCSINGFSPHLGDRGPESKDREIRRQDQLLLQGELEHHHRELRRLRLGPVRKGKPLRIKGPAARR